MDFMAGCVGGITGVIVGHPLDTVKVMMQVDNRHGSIASCVKSVIAKDSFSGLYRGVAGPMAAVAFTNSTVFGIQRGCQRQFEDPNSLKSHAIAGAIAGLCQSFFCSPTDLAKTRLQLGVQGRAASGPLACLADIARREGPLAVFRGLNLTIVRDVPAFATYFVAFEALCKTPNGEPPGSFRTLMAGGFAGCSSWLVSFPIDALKSRIQADGMNGPRMYSGAMDCMRKSLKADGVSFFFRGLPAVLLRAFPSNAATFWTVEFIMNLYSPKSLPRVVAAERLVHRCDLHYASNAYRSFVFTSALSEIICPNDVRDLHEDFRMSNVGDICRRCLMSVPVKIGILKEVEINS